MKRLVKTRLAFAGALLALGLLASLPASAQVSGGIEGKITGLDGQPLQKAEIDITRVDIKGNYKVNTDKKGHYGHYALPLGVFDVAVKLPNGQSVTIAKNVKTDLGNPKEVDANLKQMQDVAEGNAPPPGMSPEEVKAFEAKKAAKEAEQKKLGQLNGLLAQNKQLVDAKQYDQAIQVMEQAVQLDQTHAVLYANLAEDYSDAKQYDKAADAYQKAIALAPTESSYLINLGSVYSKEGKMADANAEFAKAAAMDPSNATMAMYNTAVTLMNQGNLDGASQAFDKLLAVDPNNADAWYYKGICLLSKSQTDPKTGKLTPPPGTVEALQKSIQLAPNGDHANDAKEALKTAQGGGAS